MEWIELEKLSNIELGKTPVRKESTYWQGNNTWLSIGDLNEKYVYKSKEKITDKAIMESNMKIVPKDTVIMSFKLSIGKRAITKNALYTNEAIAAFHIKDTDIIYNEYLYYALGFVDLLQYTDKAVKGKTLNKTKLRKIKIPVPSMEIQEQIVEVLDRAEGLIRDRQEQIKLLDTLVTAEFYNMFGKIATNSKNLPEKKFKDICKVNQGLQIPISKRKEKGGENRYKYITVQYLNGNKKEEYIENPSKTVICKKNDILMTRTGNTGMVITDVEGVFHNNFFKIDFDRSLFLKEYLIYYLKDRYIQADIKNRAGTSTIPDLNHSDFYNIKVLIPELSLQHKFSSIVSKIEKQKAMLTKSLKLMEDNYSSIMQRAFNGELFR